MPLVDHVPPIDNRRFDDIVEEARTRIPRYTPEWTDLNDNDPGMTLVQLFAWMTEMMLYRLGRVPELNHLKFLELLGIELSPARPARTEVAFPVKPGHPEPYVLVPQRQQVAAEGADGSRIIFETERALTAHRASLVAVQRRRGATYEGLTAQNDEALRPWHPFGSRPAEDDRLLLGFDEPLAPARPLTLSFLAAEATGDSEPVRCGLDPTPIHISAELAWEFWDGSTWRPLALRKDETRLLTRSGAVHLRSPERDAMAAVPIGRVDEPLYWIRARLLRAGYGRAPRLTSVRSNTVPALQAETVENEVLGGADGTPHQRFRLAFSPVLHDTLRLEVDEGDREGGSRGFREWTRVDDFFGSGPDDRHYVLNRTTGEIVFGDGERGGIPVANPANPNANVVARSYRHGGGTSGNVPAGSVNTLLTSVTGIDAGDVRNLRGAYGGQDEETLDEAKLRAPRSLKSKCRAVTTEDFEHHATEVADIRRAKALALHHPSFPDVPVPGAVTVIVVPGGDAPDPAPSEGALRTVCAHLDRRRLLTTEVHVVGPTYVRVEIRTEVVAEDHADPAEVHDAVESALRDYFHPLRGGERGRGWPFGGTIYYSQAYQRVFGVAGVQRIGPFEILLDGRSQPACEDVPIPDAALVYSTEHRVAVSQDFDAAPALS